MKGRIRDLLLYCHTVDFGRDNLSKREGNFYQRFSNEIVSLCRSLPESVQANAMLFLMQYSGINPGDELDFFANYYPPVWSILFWLSHDCALPVDRLKEVDVTNAVTAQSMALFLHSLDDHLIDGQVSVSSLTLLLRSQAWKIMNHAFCNLAEGVLAGEATVQGFVDDYYSSIEDSKELESLDRYCDLFRRQMAIGMIAPVLLSMRMNQTSDFTRDVELAYGSFGIAWRLLDDIRDIAGDIENGAHSALYVCLPKEIRGHWNDNPRRSQAAAKDSTNAILNHILQHSLVDKIEIRICSELETAASIVAAYNMTGLAREFRSLARPLGHSSSVWEECNGRPDISPASK